MNTPTRNIKPRANYDILKKGGAHGKSRGAKRAADKRALKRDVKEGGNV